MRSRNLPATVMLCSLTDEQKTKYNTPYRFFTISQVMPRLLHAKIGALIYGCVLCDMEVSNRFRMFNPLSAVLQADSEVLNISTVHQIQPVALLSPCSPFEPSGFFFFLFKLCSWLIHHSCTDSLIRRYLFAHLLHHPFHCHVPPPPPFPHPACRPSSSPNAF